MTSSQRELYEIVHESRYQVMTKRDYKEHEPAGVVPKLGPFACGGATIAGDSEPKTGNFGYKEGWL